jgi:hypothetical protein
MYIQVKLLKGFKEPLLYKIPEDWSVAADTLIGAIVQVPLKNHTTHGLVVAVVDTPQTSFKNFPMMPPMVFFSSNYVPIIRLNHAVF